jgi:hypothetical protein
MARLSWLKDERRLSILLTIVAAILYSYSLTQAKFQIGYFGSIHSLPISFFVALFLLTVASAILWVSPQPQGKLLALQLGLFIIALHLTMLAIGGVGASLTGGSALYSEVGLSEYVFRTGHFSSPPPDLWRLNWPTAMLINTSIMLIAGTTDANFIIALNIFAWLLLITPLVYLFMRNTIGKDRVNYCLAGTWLFFLANWLLYYLLPVIVGYLLLLVVISLLAQSVVLGRGSISFPYQLCLILILLVLPATHLLTALVALSMLLAVYAISKVRAWGLALILGVMIGAWTIYITAGFFEWRLLLFVEQIQVAFRLDRIWHMGVTERMIGSEASQIMNKLRVVFAVLFCTIGVAGGAMGLKSQKITSTDKFVIATAIGMLAVLLVISGAYAHELIQRAYFYVIPAIAYFGVKLLKNKTAAIILTILLVTALPLRFIAHYGNAIVDSISPSESRGAYFFHEHVRQGYFTGAFIVFPLGFMENRENYHFVSWERLKWENGEIHSPLGYPHYIYFRPIDQAIFDFIGFSAVAGITEKGIVMWSEMRQNIDNATNSALIYANPGISIYMVVPP